MKSSENKHKILLLLLPSKSDFKYTKTHIADQIQYNTVSYRCCYYIM